jgi:hypothetical protein
MYVILTDQFRDFRQSVGFSTTGAIGPAPQCRKAWESAEKLRHLAMAARFLATWGGNSLNSMVEPMVESHGYKMVNPNHQPGLIYC